MIPFIPRDRYLDKLIAFKDKRIIKVITGIRRCGKSTLLEIFQQYLLSLGVNRDQITAINFEDMEYDELRDAKLLHQYINNNLKTGAKNYIFLDEIQQVDDFQRVVDSMYLNKDVDIYITGSNAKMLSGEIASLLSGRYVEIEMLPLSFMEYVDFSGNRNELARKYQNYIEFSSFPYSLELGDDRKLVRDYLSGVFNTVILKDVVARNKISDVM
ncbi:MAG: ATPase, partial [Spirochaetes bacterium]